MKKLSMAAIAVVLLATPLAGAYAYPDAETQDTLDWQVVVEKANANRLGLTQPIENQGDVAAVQANQANDAAQAVTRQGPAAHAEAPAKYHNVLEIHDDN